MLKGFKDFLMRGNVVDLAVAVVIGTAFAQARRGVRHHHHGSRRQAGRHPDFSQWNPGGVSVGLFLEALFAFLIVALAVYFMVVVPMNRLAERRKRGEEPEPEAPSEEVILLTEIRDALRVR